MSDYRTGFTEPEISKITFEIAKTRQTMTIKFDNDANNPIDISRKQSWRIAEDAQKELKISVSDMKQLSEYIELARTSVKNGNSTEVTVTLSADGSIRRTRK